MKINSECHICWLIVLKEYRETLLDQISLENRRVKRTEKQTFNAKAALKNVKTTAYGALNLDITTNKYLSWKYSNIT